MRYVCPLKKFRSNCIADWVVRHQWIYSSEKFSSFSVGEKASRPLWSAGESLCRFDLSVVTCTSLCQKCQQVFLLFSNVQDKLKRVAQRGNNDLFLDVVERRANCNTCSNFHKAKIESLKFHIALSYKDLSFSNNFTSDSLLFQSPLKSFFFIFYFPFFFRFQPLSLKFAESSSNVIFVILLLFNKSCSILQFRDFSNLRFTLAQKRWRIFYSFWKLSSRNLVFNFLS